MSHNQIESFGGRHIENLKLSLKKCSFLADLIGITGVQRNWSAFPSPITNIMSHNESQWVIMSHNES